MKRPSVFGRTKNIAWGYIFSPGCDLPPAAHPDKVKAMTDAVNEFGWYD